MRRVDVAGTNVLLARSKTGDIHGYHNVCPHRGSELCTTNEQPLRGGRILCPYHAWSFNIDGSLASTAAASRAPDFDPSVFGLYPVGVTDWNGLLFVCPTDAPEPFGTDNAFGTQDLDNWPMRDLVTAYRETHLVECNWKILWENFSECLHCPGVHPSLCDLIPIHKKGLLAYYDDPDWSPETPAPESELRPGARSWTISGQAATAEFPGLTDDQRSTGHVYCVIWPTLFVVAHVDYISIVSYRPLGAEQTEVTGEVLLSPSALADPDFDLAQIVTFNQQVQDEDAAVCELNQRGLRSSPFASGVLMPEEYNVKTFHEWLRRRMDAAAAVAIPAVACLGVERSHVG
jgi:Rieske 2Fe-2S family protein